MNNIEETRTKSFKTLRRHAQTAQHFQKKAEAAMQRGDHDRAIYYHNKMIMHQRLAASMIHESSENMSKDDIIKNAIRKAMEDHAKNINQKVINGGYIHGNYYVPARNTEFQIQDSLPGKDETGRRIPYNAEESEKFKKSMKDLVNKHGGVSDEHGYDIMIQGDKLRHHVVHSLGTARAPVGYFTTPKQEKVNEALDIIQRQKRAQVMRRYENKIARARELAKRKLAPDSIIKKRAYAQARMILRKRVAGSRGAEYEKLGPSEKMAIDRLIDGKTKIIKKIALRLIPRVKQDEMKRLQSFMAGAPLKNLGSPEKKSPNSNINERFEEKFVTNTEKRKIKLFPKNQKNKIKILSKFDESKEYRSLAKKAEDSNIDIDILRTVYNRGITSWNESYSLSPSQYAFSRVNSFINQGKSFFEEDADLAEEVYSSLKKPVYVPPEMLPSGKTRPAKFVLKRTNRKIIKSGNVHDGK